MKAKIGLCWAWLAMTVVSKVQSGTVVLEAKPVTVRGGLMAAGPQEHAPNAQTYGRRPRRRSYRI